MSNKTEIAELKRMLLVSNSIHISRHTALLAQVLKQGVENKQNKEQLKALAFVLDQVNQRGVGIQFIQKAITQASFDYNAILGTAASKSLDVEGLVMFVAFALVPEMGAMAVILKSAGDGRDKIQLLITSAKALGKVYDLRKKFRVTQPAQQGPKSLEKANEVLSEVYDEFLKIQVLNAEVLSQFVDKINEGSLANPVQELNRLWNQAGIKVIQLGTFTDEAQKAEVLRNLILYDMLRAYTSKYVTMGSQSLFPSGMIPAAISRGELDGIPSKSVSVDGFNDNQREEIYKRFSKVPWTDVGKRPPVNSWRDLIKHWGARTS